MSVLLKYLLTHVGELLSPNANQNLNATVNYLEVGRWMHAKGYDPPHRVGKREQLFDLVGVRVADKKSSTWSSECFKEPLPDTGLSSYVTRAVNCMVLTSLKDFPKIGSFTDPRVTFRCKDASLKATMFGLSSSRACLRIRSLTTGFRPTMC